MNLPRIAVLGAGNLSSRRIYPYLAPAGAQLVGTCDLDGEKAGRLAALYNTQAFTDYEKMLAETKPDGVIVCIGPEQHAELAPKILRLGFPVYTEKPPAATAAGALEVARAAKETGLLCMTGFKKRHNNAYSRAKEWLAQFAESDYLSLSMDYASDRYPNDSPRGEFLLDFALHIIDLTPWLFGEVAEVFAFAKGMDAYAVSLRFANGAVGSLSLSDGRSFHIPTEEVELTVAGGNFMTIRNSSSWRISEGNQCTEWREPPTFVSGGDSGTDTGHLAELSDFVAALREGRTTSRSHINESYGSMVLYESIKESAESGKVVRVDVASV